MKEFEIEIERKNVTPSQFLAYVRNRVDAKGGKDLRGDLDLAYFKAGNDLNFNHYHDNMHEISISKPYEMQTCIINADGSRYNEICEFTFDETGKTGIGYYYLVNAEAEAEAAEAEAEQEAQPEQPEEAAEAEATEEEEAETMKNQNETITIYGTEVDRSELAAALIEAELNSYCNKNIDYCVILDTETGKPEVDQYTPGSSSKRVWEGLDVILWTTNNKYYSAFSDWMAPTQTAEENNIFVRDIVSPNNIFVRDIVSPEAWKKATEDADGDPETWRYIPSGWSAELDSAVVDVWGSELVSQFDTDEIIFEIERRAAEEAHAW